jgi:chorismate mutase
MGGAGQHKDKKKAEKQGSVKHKKSYMESLRTKIDQLKSKLAEAGMPFRGVDGAFNRGDDERHDLDPTDWYVVKDGKMFKTSVYPNQEKEAMARGYSRTRDEAKAKAGKQGAAEGVRDLGYDAQSLIMKLRRDVEEKRLQPTPQAVLAAARELAGDMEFAPQLLVKQVLGQGVAEGSGANKTYLAMAYLKAVVMAPTGTPDNERIRNWQEKLEDEFDIEMDTVTLAQMLPQFDSQLQSGNLDKLQNRMAGRGELEIGESDQGVAEAPEDRTSYQVAKILSDRGIKYDPAQENELINAIGMVLVKELNMSPKEARYLISYDEDFVSDTLGELRSMEQSVSEVAPPGWEKTVKAMKKHDNIDNPFALAWSMKNKGYKSHKKESADPYFESLRAKVEELAKK